MNCLILLILNYSFIPSKKHIDRKHQFQFSILIIVVLAVWYFVAKQPSKDELVVPTDRVEYSNSLERTQANYSRKVYEVSKDLDISYEYLMALIAIETSGFKPPGKRFEKRVYKQLQNVKSGRLKKYENIRKKTLKDASSDAIRNLATSWGPFQLMGYKCVGMDVNVHNLRSDSSVYYGAIWIKSEYGKLLRKGKYEDAFHYHNTGRKIPRNGKHLTHDPNYIKNGIKYMAFFEKNKP